MRGKSILPVETTHNLTFFKPPSNFYCWRFFRFASNFETANKIPCLSRAYILTIEKPPLANILTGRQNLSMIARILQYIAAFLLQSNFFLSLSFPPLQKLSLLQKKSVIPNTNNYSCRPCFLNHIFCSSAISIPISN